MARVIKATEVQDFCGGRTMALKLTDLAEEARAVVLEARKEAARIVAEARERAQAVAQSAQDQGYAEGLARGESDGYAQGERKARQEAEATLAATSAELASLAGNVIQELAQARGEVIQQARLEMLQLAIQLSEKIVGRVAVSDISAAQANLAKALELVGGGNEFTIQVNGDQLEALNEYMKDLADLLASSKVRMVADDQVSPGGVRLTTRAGQVDATIQTQLDNVVEALLGRRRPAEAAGSYMPFAARLSGKANLGVSHGLV